MSNNSSIDVSSSVMSKITQGQIKMKPRWYFIVGSFAMMGGMIGLVIFSIYCVSLTAFSLRTHGPMGSIRFEQLLQSFPWWAPIAAIVGISVGGWVLRQYDFSYKRKFRFLLAIFIFAILFSGWFIDAIGLYPLWLHRGRMHDQVRRGY